MISDLSHDEECLLDRPNIDGNYLYHDRTTKKVEHGRRNYHDRSNHGASFNYYHY